MGEAALQYECHKQAKELGHTAPSTTEISVCVTSECRGEGEAREPRYTLRVQCTREKSGLRHATTSTTETRGGVLRVRIRAALPPAFLQDITPTSIVTAAYFNRHGTHLEELHPTLSPAPWHRQGCAPRVMSSCHT